MKVLLVWSEIPEDVKLFILEGTDAELSIKCHNLYINMDEDESGNLEALSMLLMEKQAIDSSNPVDIHDFDKVVLSGFYL